MVGVNNKIIFGKNNTQRIVGCEALDDQIELFIEEADGTIKSVIRPHRYWIVSSSYEPGWTQLNGNQHYKYVNYFTSLQSYTYARKRLYSRYKDFYSVWDEREQAMIDRGFTYFKGMKVEDVSVLAFDIESRGLTFDEGSYVYIITNTFQKQGKIIRKMFSCDEYKTQTELINAWCNWVREVNPSVITGHNIYTYDLPYLQFVASLNNTNLSLGRDGSSIKFNEKPSKFRKDGSQFYTYQKAYVYGRNLIDTMFLALKYDTGRKYESYGLKNIIKHEGWEVEGRQHYDASLISKNWNIKVEREKIKKYALYDADDALMLYNKMIAPFFYMTQSAPKTFQEMLTSATGSQINSMLVRAYMQDGYSLPKASPAQEYEGAISLGNPGNYKYGIKYDIASLYPSLIMQYRVYSKSKDPKGYFLSMLEYFAIERLKNKKTAKETNDPYYMGLEQSQKQAANSFYGFLGAEGLLFNAPSLAAFITEKGRDVLKQAMKWAEDKRFTLINADTDSITITNGTDLNEQQRQNLLDDLNSNFPEKIRFTDDGYFPNILVIKVKNYVMFDGKKMKYKGSALKATNKEPALKEFIEKAVKILMFGTQSELVELYEAYVEEVLNITNIDRWSSKHTVTEKVLKPERTNEQKLYDAIAGTDYRESDKIYTYFTKTGKVKLREHWDNDHDEVRLLKKLHQTALVFETVVDKTIFTNYALKKNYKLLKKNVDVEAKVG